MTHTYNLPDNDVELGLHNSEVVVPFGKYHGLKLKEVPEDYLQWMVGMGRTGQPIMRGTTNWSDKAVRELSVRLNPVKGLEISMPTLEVNNNAYQLPPEEKTALKDKEIHMTLTGVDKAVQVALKEYVLQRGEEPRFSEWLKTLVKEALRYGELEATPGVLKATYSKLTFVMKMSPQALTLVSVEASNG